jgi:hypothetical protein
MKKLSIIFSILLIVFLNAAKAQTNLEFQLRNFPIANYLNKPIDSILAHLPVGYDTTFEICPTGNINRGAALQINYQPNYKFKVYINITDAQYISVQRDFRFTRSEVAWPIALLRKEKVGSVTIYKFPLEIINEADIY